MQWEYQQDIIKELCSSHLGLWIISFWSGHVHTASSLLDHYSAKTIIFLNIHGNEQQQAPDALVIALVYFPASGQEFCSGQSLLDLSWLGKSAF